MCHFLMNTKTSFAIVLGIILCVVFAGIISACDYQDPKGCKVNAETYIQGRVTYNDTSIKSAEVTVTCIHNEVEYTKTTRTNSGKGHLRGTYFVKFKQSQCISGDTVIVTATKDGSTGTATGKVEDFLKQKCFDIDLAWIDVNIPLVPEFGKLAIILTALGAVGIFFVVRRK